MNYEVLVSVMNTLDNFWFFWMELYLSNLQRDCVVEGSVVYKIFHYIYDLQ